MADRTTELTNLDPRITQFQNDLRNKYEKENKTALKGQILFVGSSLMEIFPIEKWEKERDLGLNKYIYNRGVRATTTEDLLVHMDTLVFELEPSKIFINIGSNDIGFKVPEETRLANYSKILQSIKEKLPNTEVYTMAYYPMNTIDDFGESQKEHSSLFNTRSNEAFTKASENVKKITTDIGYKFINVNDGLANDNGQLKPELTFDGAHMLPAGYEIVLNNLRKYL